MTGVQTCALPILFNVEVTVETDNVQGGGLDAARPQQLSYSSADESGAVRSNEVSRNAPCPCGSGKKFKRCHGAA